MALEAGKITNVRVLRADAVDVLAKCIPDISLDAVLLYFPDPWPKKRHHKRRLIQPKFAALVARKLKTGGRFHLATDWPDYAAHMLAVLSASPDFTAAEEASYVPQSPDRPPTKFERRGLKLGNPVTDLIFVRR